MSGFASSSSASGGGPDDEDEGEDEWEDVVEDKLGDVVKGEVVTIYHKPIRLKKEIERLIDSYDTSSRRNTKSNKSTRPKTKSNTSHTFKVAKRHKLTLVPIEDEDEKCDDNVESCELTGSCRSANYLELVSAINVCFKPKTYKDYLRIIEAIKQDAEPHLSKKTKYVYRNKICFSNAKRAYNHCRHFLEKTTEKELNDFLLWVDTNVSLPRPLFVNSVYVGYIPSEALIEDPDNEKHQTSSDVYVLLENKQLIGISCKAYYNCSLTNWWIDSYLIHCRLRDAYDFFKACVATRKQETQQDKWDDDEKIHQCEIKGKLVMARYKDCMREKWRLEDLPIRTESEPIFIEGTPMSCIQKIFKNEESCLIIMRNAISDIFGQTLPYDFYLLAAGVEPLFLKMNEHAPDMDSIHVEFDGEDSTSGNSAKFIFNVSVNCKNSYLSEQQSRFYFKVEIRRSGGIDDYRIHFILKNIIPLESDKSGGGNSSSASGGGGGVFGGSRRHKRKTLKKRKTRRRK